MYAYHYVGSRMQQGAMQKPFQHALAASSFHRAFIHLCSADRWYNQRAKANDHITLSQDRRGERGTWLLPKHQKFVIQRKPAGKSYTHYS